MLSSQAIADKEMDASDQAIPDPELVLSSQAIADQEKATPDPDLVVSSCDPKPSDSINLTQLKLPLGNFDPNFVIVGADHFQRQKEKDPILVTFRNNEGEAETASDCRADWRYKNNFTSEQEYALLFAAWIWDNHDILIDAYKGEVIFKSAIYPMILATYFLCTEKKVPGHELWCPFDRNNPIEKTLRLMHHFEGLEIRGNGWVGIVRGISKPWDPTKVHYTWTDLERIDEHKRADHLKFLLMLATEIYEAKDF